MGFRPTRLPVQLTLPLVPENVGGQPGGRPSLGSNPALGGTRPESSGGGGGGSGAGGQGSPAAPSSPGGSTGGSSPGGGSIGSLIPTFAVSLLRTPPIVAPLPAACQADQSCNGEVCQRRMACGPDAHCQALRCSGACFEACILNQPDASPTACPTSELSGSVCGWAACMLHTLSVPRGAPHLFF